MEDGSAFVLVRQDVHPLQHRLCKGPICIQGGMGGAVEPSFTSGLPRAHHVLGHRSAGIIAVVFHAGNVDDILSTSFVRALDMCASRIFHSHRFPSLGLERFLKISHCSRMGGRGEAQRLLL